MAYFTNPSGVAQAPRPMAGNGQGAPAGTIFQPWGGAASFLPQHPGVQSDGSFDGRGMGSGQAPQPGGNPLAQMYGNMGGGGGQFTTLPQHPGVQADGSFDGRGGTFPKPGAPQANPLANAYAPPQPQAPPMAKQMSGGALQSAIGQMSPGMQGMAARGGIYQPPSPQSPPQASPLAPQASPVAATTHAGSPAPAPAPQPVQAQSPQAPSQQPSFAPPAAQPQTNVNGWQGGSGGVPYNPTTGWNVFNGLQDPGPINPVRPYGGAVPLGQQYQVQRPY